MNLKEDRDFLKIEKDFKRIAKLVELFWGTDMLCDYIDNICKDSRDGERNGFPLEIFDSLAKLKSAHMRFFPQFNKPFTAEDVFTFR